MSHFVGMCFGSFWENDLEQYDENILVPPYVVYTKQEAIEEAKCSHRNLYKRATQNSKDDWAIHIISTGEYLTDEKAWDEVKSWGYNIDENENLISTYNPNSKWDWYTIGGRWNGWLKLKESQSGCNISTINNVDWDYMFNHRLPFCFVTTSGEWYESGEMGWFASVNNEMPESEWLETFRQYVLSEDEDCEVTIVDFHI